MIPHWRKLTPLQEETIRALAGKVPYRVLASQYGVSKRTIARTVERTPLDVVVVQLGGYYAQFEVHETGPIQRTDWRAVAA